ncbi:MAG: imidazole glycerol phosphate synthase subunit HisH [Hyphobacterium sp.]|nr:MAG: imidazole glycerol phosphate synthase subunit HisH [Hyphobacterium sp.]
MKLAIVDTASANRFSVETALARMSVNVLIAPTPADAKSADGLVLPGVGAAAPAMTALKASGWADRLQRETRPVLGICLGMQLLFENSEEGDVDTLGIIAGRVRRLSASAQTWPHMGWNTLQKLESDPLLTGLHDGDFLYFAHGFYVPPGPTTLACVNYGEDISAIVRRGNFMGCQFHPEKSSAAGRQILENFCAMIR